MTVDVVIAVVRCRPLHYDVREDAVGFGAALSAF